MLDVKIKERLAGELFSSSKIISLKLQGDDIFCENIALAIVENNDRKFLTEEEYRKFITPYLSRWLASCKQSLDDEWNEFETYMNQVISEETDEEIIELLEEELVKKKNVFEAMRQYQNLSIKRSADAMF